MKTLLSLAAFCTLASAVAQPVVSPEVHPDGRITFRLRATNATIVEVRCEGIAATNLVKDERGVWSQTVGPLDPDIYVYSFGVDGLRMMDPNNPFVKYNLLNSENQVHVPGPKSLPWELNDVPRGELHRHFYKSTVSDDERDFMVYTPPGYDPAARKRYPVLYLLHGFSDETTAWTSIGRANVILDNLIAARQARPMIVVMPLGYGTMEYVRAGWTGARRAELRQRSFEKFRDGLFTEVMPQAEKRYRIEADRRSRAIAGLSMGGAEALFVGLNGLDRFAWIGAFSSGGLGTNFSSQFPSLDATANDRLRLLWIGCGQQDGLIGSNRNLSAWLKTQGVKHTWLETPGQHSFRVWRRYLAEFSTQLFQSK